MRILIDTNVLISAFVFGGRTRAFLLELLQSDHELIVTEYVEKELQEKLKAKWPDQQEKLLSLFKAIDFKFCKSAVDIHGVLRDPKDDPVLADARLHHVDVILTGDKDFLEADIDYPIILSPSLLDSWMKEKKSFT